MAENDSKTTRISTKTAGPSHLIYWVRHGETIGNIERIYRDPMSAVLTERGRHQAKLAGEALSDVVFTRAYSSHLPRATETAEIILKHSKTPAVASVKLRTDPRIREREHGCWEGRSYDEAALLRGKGIDKNHPLFPYARFCVEGTENVLDIIERMESFVTDVLKELNESSSNDDGQVVLIISHGFVSDVFMTYLGLPNPKYNLHNYSNQLTIALQNCGYHIMSWRSEAAENRQDPVICINFLETHRDEHLSSIGFVSIRH